MSSAATRTTFGRTAVMSPDCTLTSGTLPERLSAPPGHARHLS